MEYFGALAAVWALSSLVAAAGGLLDSLLITAVGVLAVGLALAGGVAVWTTDSGDRHGWATTPDRAEK